MATPSTILFITGTITVGIITMGTITVGIITMGTITVGTITMGTIAMGTITVGTITGTGDRYGPAAKITAKKSHSGAEPSGLVAEPPDCFRCRSPFLE